MDNEHALIGLKELFAVDWGVKQGKVMEFVGKTLVYESACELLNVNLII